MVYPEMDKTLLVPGSIELCMTKSDELTDQATEADLTHVPVVHNIDLHCLTEWGEHLPQYYI